MSARPGNVILVKRGNGILDRAVQFATVSPFFHAALVADHGDLIEARFRGVSRRPVDEYAGRSDVFTVAGATDAQREAVVAFAQSKMGQPYGFEDVIADALRLGLHIPVGYHWRHWGRLDCSCLVAAAWATAGVWLTYAPAPSPADLGWSPILLGKRPWRGEKR